MAYQEINEVMNALAQNHDKSPINIYVDNCCQWRNKLQSSFPDAVVYLDIFHAFQRISKTISKYHSFCFEVNRDMKLIFRDFDDNGEKRTKPTPNPETMMKRIDQFLNKWKNIDFKGWKVISSKTLLAFEQVLCFYI